MSPVALIVALSGCSGAETPPADRVLPPELAVCATHAGDDRLLGYCLASQAVLLRHLDLSTVCGQVTPYARECRHNWAAARARWSPETPLATLLEACRADGDCAFDVLDARNPPDLVTTIGLCRTFVTDHVRDCVGHAAARWAESVTLAEEVARVAAMDEEFDWMIGFHLATAVVCREIEGALCPVAGPRAQACKSRARQLRAEPSECPETPFREEPEP